MTRASRNSYLTFILLGILSLLLTSCTGTITSALIGPALENMQKQSDVMLVCEGTPAYLLLIDSMIADDPTNEDLLILGAKSFTGVIGAMQECGSEQDRILAMADKGYLYGSRLLSLKAPVSPGDSIELLDKKLQTLDKDDAAALFWGGFSWLAWIQQQSGSPLAIAGLTKVEKILLRVTELDETIQQGAVHFLLGGFYGARPEIIGGNPVKSKYHFDKSLEISQRKMLIFQTTYAETLARTVGDRELHDSLLKEVVEYKSDPAVDNVLANSIAQKKAQRLLEEEFFQD